MQARSSAGVSLFERYPFSSVTTVFCIYGVQEVFLGTLSRVLSPTFHSNADRSVTTSRLHTLVTTGPGIRSYR